MDQIDVYHDLENFTLHVENHKIDISFIIKNVNNKSLVGDLFDMFKKQFKSDTGLDYTPNKADVCFHLEDNTEIDCNDTSLSGKTFQDFGINRFSKLHYHNGHKHK
jgi:hypothetical protein